MPLWVHAQCRRELLQFLGDYRDTVTEVAFFTGITHPAVPPAVLLEPVFYNLVVQMRGIA